MAEPRYERDVQRQLIKLAQRRGMLAFKVQAIGVRGFPDVLVAYLGNAMFIEVKTLTGKVDLQQIALHRMLRDAGLNVQVVHGLNHAWKLLNQFYSEALDKRTRQHEKLGAERVSTGRDQTLTE